MDKGTVKEWKGLVMGSDSAKKSAQEYQKQAAEAAAAARAAASEAAAAAAQAAARAKDWAGPQVDNAKEWLGPRAKHLYAEGARRSEPYVRKAGHRVGDWSDALHAAVVGAAIPAVIAAVDNAAHSEDEPSHKSVWPKVLVPALLVGAATAALVVWARRDPGRDTWAGEDDEWEFADDSAFKEQLRDGVNRAADAAVDAAKRAAAAASAAASVAAEVVTEKAGPAAAKVKDSAVTAAKEVAEAAGPAVTKVKDTAVAEAKKVRGAAEDARAKAAAGLAETFDDAEDVWEDEGGTNDDGLTPVEHVEPVAKKPAAPRKPRTPKADA
jgi:hypothetical protein